MFIGQIGRVHILRNTTEAGGAGGAGQVEAGAGSTETTTEQPAASGVPEGFTKGEWDNLTPGEQAAFAITDEDIADNEDEFPDLEDLDAVIGEDDTAGEAKPDVTAAKPGDTTIPDAAAPAATTYGTDGPTYEDFLSMQITAPAPPLVTGIPAEWKAKLAEVDEKFREGDLDDDARDAAKDEIRQALTDWKIEQRDAAKESGVFAAEVEAFRVSMKDVYRVTDDKGVISRRSMMLDAAFVNEFNAMSKDPANASKTNRSLLIQADKAVREAFNIPAPGKKAAPVQQAAPAKPAVPQARLSKDAVNLAALPAAGDHDTDPFAAVESLTGIQKEEALARMTPAQEAAYLRGSR